MGDRFAHCEESLLQVELAAKQNGDELRRGARLVRCRDQLRQPIPVMGAQLLDTCARTRNGRPCEGRMSVSGASAENAVSESRNRASGSPSGSAGQTLTLVLILGRSISPEMQTFIVSQWSAACSGE